MIKAPDPTFTSGKSPGDLGDEQGILHHRPPKPANFSVGISADKQHVIFRIKDVLYPQIREVLSEYRVYFISAETVSPNDIIKPDIAYRAFQQSQLCGSTPPSGRPGLIEWESDRKWMGRDGWFFATSVNIAALESDPTPPVRAPQGAEVGDSAVPGDVTAFQVSLRAEYVANRSYVRVQVSALTPEPLGSFAGYQIYLKGYRWDGDFDDAPVMEGHFVAASTQGGGDLLSDSFLMDPDIATPYTAGTVAIDNGSATVIGTGTDWALSWATNHIFAVYAVDASFPAEPILWTPTITGVTSPTQLTISFGPTWFPGAGLEYAIFPVLTQGTFADQPFFIPPHRVRMYAVAVSKAGTRRPDVTNSPFVDFQFGLGAALTKPDNPYSISAYVQPDTTLSSQGGVVTLRWAVTRDFSTGLADSTLHHFNVYRQRAGTHNNPVDPAPAKPLTPFATVPFDRAMSAEGQYTWVDKAFNTDPTKAPNATPPVPPTAADAWDFNPADLGEYVYWVQAVNVEGTENHSAYWGTLTSAGGTTLTQTGGDAFTDDFVGKTITLLGTDPLIQRTVTGRSGSTITVSGAAITAATYDYGVGSVTGRVTLVGNASGEGDPTLHDADYFNRLFNANFISVASVANTDEILATDHNSGYAAAATLGDGQPTFSRFFTDPLYTVGANTGAEPFQNGSQNAQAAGLPPTYVGGSPPIGATADDNWSAWQYYISTAGLEPAFVCSATAGSTATTGEMVLYGGALAGDFSAITQLIQKRKLAPGMPFALSFYARTPVPESVGIILAQVIRYDARNFSNAAYSPNPTLGVEREGNIGGTVQLSTVNDVYQRFTVLGRLPSGDPATRTGITANNLSTTITTATPNFDQGWIGCTATVKQGATTHVSEIRQVTGGTPPDACDTIVLAAAWPAANVTNATLDVAITFTHYIVKIGVNDVGGAASIYIRYPMLNSGLKAAPWQATMDPKDQPGGIDQVEDADPAPNPRPGCVPAGTLVMTPSGEREIQNLAVGETVLCYASGQIAKTRIAAVNKHSTMRLMTIHTNNRELVCTPTHRLLVSGVNRYRIADDVLGAKLVGVVGDRLTSERVSVVGVQELAAPVTVYTLSCEPRHNYIAGGLVCHNKPPVVEQP